MKILSCLLLCIPLHVLALESSLREYTNVDGRKMSASLIGFDGERVGFVMKNGVTSYYPVEKLSSADRDFLLEHPLYSLPKVDFDLDAPFPSFDEKEDPIFVDRKGGLKFKSSWKNVPVFSGSYAKVSFQDGVNGFIDVNGKTKLRVSGGWSFVGEYTDDLILMTHASTAKFKYIDSRGRDAFDQEYQQAKRMMEGVAWVSEQWKKSSSVRSVTDVKWNLVDKKGKIVFTLSAGAEPVDDFFDSGVCRVRMDRNQPAKVTYINKVGDEVFSELDIGGVPPRFYGGYAVVKGGLLDSKGVYTLKPEAGFSMLSSQVTEGVVLASKGKNFYIIDAKSGESIAMFPFGYKPGKEGAQCGLIRFSDASDPRKFGFVNRAGKVVIEPQYLLASAFVNGFSQIRSADYKTKAVINLHGEVIYTEKPPEE